MENPSTLKLNNSCITRVCTQLINQCVNKNQKLWPKYNERKCMKQVGTMNSSQDLECFHPSSNQVNLTALINPLITLFLTINDFVEYFKFWHHPILQNKFYDWPTDQRLILENLLFTSDGQKYSYSGYKLLKAKWINMQKVAEIPKVTFNNRKSIPGYTFL